MRGNLRERRIAAGDTALKRKRVLFRRKRKATAAPVAVVNVPVFPDPVDDWTEFVRWLGVEIDDVALDDVITELDLQGMSRNELLEICLANDVLDTSDGLDHYNTDMMRSLLLERFGNTNAARSRPNPFEAVARTNPALERLRGSMVAQQARPMYRLDDEDDLDL